MPRDGWPCLSRLSRFTRPKAEKAVNLGKFLGNTEAKGFKGKAYEFGTVHAERLRTTRLEGVDYLNYSLIGL
jgi:hypothetical protein